MDPAIILFGLGVGVLVGTTGMGGGSLMTPLLILVIGIKPVVAVGSDLAYSAVTKTVGGWRHFRKGTVFPRPPRWLPGGPPPGAPRPARGGGGRVRGPAPPQGGGRRARRLDRLPARHHVRRVGHADRDRA